MDAQQQTQSDSFYNFLAWLEVNKKRLMIWTAAVLAVVAVAIIVITYQTQKERRAYEALSNVRAPSIAANAPLTGTADAYLKVAKEHAGTQAGANALLLAGVTRFVEGAYADAQKHFEQFTRDYPDNRWLSQAYFGIGSALDAQQKTAEATKQFEELRRRFPNDAVIDETKLALGRLYETQNRPADAYKLYDDLVKANPYSGLGSEAGLRQAELTEKHPELARTNLPPAMTTLPMMSMTNAMTVTNRPGASNRVQIRQITNAAARAMTNLNVGKTQVVTLPLTLPTNAPAAAKP